MRYRLFLTHTYSGARSTITYDIEADTLEELKNAFLKRFGNVVNVTNKTLKEKPYVKKLTYVATNIEEWQESINTKTRWELVIQPT